MPDITTNEKSFTLFKDILIHACQGVGRDYFQLPVCNADAVYRERVYCYELYHQTRKLWNDFPYTLGGEVDKGGHPRFRDSDWRGVKPDFLVHRPGVPDDLVCIEVKALKQSYTQDDLWAIKNDFKKLHHFTSSAGYYRGIFLLYGNPVPLIDPISLLGGELRNRPNIYVARHAGVDEPATLVQLGG